MAGAEFALPKVLLFAILRLGLWQSLQLGLSRQQAVDQRPQLAPGSAVVVVHWRLGCLVHATEEHYL